MKKWQLAFDGAPSAQAEFGLKQISAAVFRHAGYKPELAPEETGRNAIALSIATNDANIPENGYRLRVEDMTNGRQRVLIQGKDDTALMHGCMEFVGNYLSRAQLSHSVDEPYYFRPLFGEEPLPPEDITSAPAIPGRGLWLWGHTLYDYRGFFENMARLRLNEVIIWNDFAPLNARELVRCAHGLGIKVIWGYAWGWDTKMVLDVSDENSEAIIAKYEAEYADIGGDGIYFQSFTETSSETLDGQLIAEAVVGFVNRTARKLLDRHPGLLLEFGLHAQSVRNRLEYIARLDSHVRVVWENCGDFPYSATPDRIGEPEKTRKFTKSILSLRPGAGSTGVVLKSMVQLDWSKFRHQTAPIRIGEADERTIRRRKKEADRIWHYVQSEWLSHGELCLDTVRSLKGRCADVYALVEDAVFERAIPYPVALLAEMLWDCDKPYTEILRATARREDIKLM